MMFSSDGRSAPSCDWNYRQLHLAIPVLRFGVGRPEDLQVPLPATPGLNDLGCDDIHENFGKAAAFGISLEVVRLFVPAKIGVEHDRQEQVIAVVDDDDLAAGSLDGRVINQVFLGAVRTDVALECKLPGDD